MNFPRMEAREDAEMLAPPSALTMLEEKRRRRR
jgi:hypothetical protein